MKDINYYIVESLNNSELKKAEKEINPDKIKEIKNILQVKLTEEPEIDYYPRHINTDKKAEIHIFIDNNSIDKNKFDGNIKKLKYWKLIDIDRSEDEDDSSNNYIEYILKEF